MLLLCVGVECRVTQVSLVTVLTFVVSTIDIVLAASTTSCLFKALILVTVALTIITGLFAIVILPVLFVRDFSRFLVWKGHGLLWISLWLGLVGTLSELLKIRHFSHSLHGVGHLDWLLLHCVLLLHVRVHGHALVGVLLLVHVWDGEVVVWLH